jgi:hypothetical protein
LKAQKSTANAPSPEQNMTLVVRMLSLAIWPAIAIGYSLVTAIVIGGPDHFSIHRFPAGIPRAQQL